MSDFNWNLVVYYPNVDRRNSAHTAPEDELRPGIEAWQVRLCQVGWKYILSHLCETGVWLLWLSFTKLWHKLLKLHFKNKSNFFDCSGTKMFQDVTTWRRCGWLGLLPALNVTDGGYLTARSDRCRHYDIIQLIIHNFWLKNVTLQFLIKEM